MRLGLLTEACGYKILIQLSGIIRSASTAFAAEQLHAGLTQTL